MPRSRRKRGDSGQKKREKREDLLKGEKKEDLTFKKHQKTCVKKRLKGVWKKGDGDELPSQGHN